MNNIKTLISILLLCFLFNNNAWTQECSGDLNGFTTLGEFENAKYYLSDHTQTWQNASAEAASLGGHLVSIGSQEENTFIKNNIGSIIPFIGYSDHLTEGNFLWDSGEVVTYTNLTATNKEDNDYAVINFWNGSWNLVNQWVHKSFVIEIPCDGGGGMNAPCQFTISDVTFPSSVVPGETFNVAATITNDATSASLPSSVNLYRFFSSPSGTSISSLIQTGGTVPTLNAGQATTVQFSLAIDAPHYENDFPSFDGNYKGDYVLMMDGSGNLPEFQACYYEPTFEIDFVDNDLEISWVDNDDCFGINRIVQADLQVKNLGNNATVAPIFVFLGSSANVQANLPGVIYENAEGFDGVYWKINQLLGPGESIALARPYQVNSTTATSITFTPAIEEDASNIDDTNLSNNSLNTTFTFDDFCTSDLPSKIVTSVFWDENSNGVRNLPEDEGISNHPVQVEDQNNNIVASDRTDDTGSVEFVGLPSGTYRLVYELIADTGVSPKNAPSGTPYTDSDINNDGKTDFFTIEDGQLIDDLAAGFTPGFMPEGSIAVHTWFDQNGDGIRGFADNAISGVQVQLEDSNGNTIYNAMTNSNGEIIFDDLLAGQYRVITQTPSGRMPTLKNAPNSTANNDSDINADGTTDLITLGPGEIITNIGAGYRTTNGETDIELSLTVDNPNPNLYQKVKMTYTIANTSQNTATDLSIKVGVCSVQPISAINNIGFFNQANGLVNTSPNPTTSLGAYNKTTQFWTIPQLAAGTSATLEVTVFVLTTEERVLVGEVNLGSPFDIDSAYGNMVDCAVEEDDEAAFVLNEEAPSTGNEPCQLSISNINFPAIVQPGEMVILSATVTNDGNQGSVPTQLSLYQQIVTLSGDFHNLSLIEEGVLVPALASGASTNIQFQVNLPDPLYVDFFNPEDLLFNNYGKYLLMIADDAENIFNPNTCFTEFDFEVDFINTDLSVEFVNNGGCYGNGIFDTDLQVTNHGNVATTAPIYVKLDAAFPFNFVDQTLPYIYFDPASVDGYWKITETLQPGESVSIDSPFGVFDEFQSSIEIVMTLLTDQSNVDDAVTSNNTAIANFVLDENCGGAGSNEPCQLSISNVNFPAIVQPGETVTISATVTNDGNQTSATSKVNLYQFRDNIHGPPPVDLVQEGATVPSLAAGASTTIQFQVTLPDPLYVNMIAPEQTSFSWSEYALVIEDDAANGAISYLNCNTPFDFEVDYRDADLGIEFVNNDGCYGNDYVVQADLKLTNYGPTTTTAPIYVRMAVNPVFINPNSDGNFFYNFTHNAVYWVINEALASGESITVNRPFKVVDGTTVEVDFGPEILLDVSNVEDSNLSNNDLTGVFDFDENCGDTNPCDYQNAQWLNDLLENDEALCIQCVGAVNVYELNNTIYIGTLADNIDCADGFTTIYTCDGTVFCMDGGVAGLNECEDWWNMNPTLVENLWTRAGNCNTGDGIDLELTLDVSNTSPNIYSHVPATYTLRNTGSETATNISIFAGVCTDGNPISGSNSRFTQGTGLVNGSPSPSPSVGNYNITSQRWTIPQLAPGATATLNLTVFTLTTDERSLFGEVRAASPSDIDSSPNNMSTCVAQEDDEALVTLNGSMGELPDFDLNSVTLLEDVFPTGLETIPANSEVIAGNTIQLNALQISGVIPGPQLNFNAVTKFYLSTDETIDANDVVLFVYDDHALNFSQPTNNYFTEGASGAFIIPENTPAGAYNIIVKFDADDEIMEANENNNINIKPIVVSNCICPHVIAPVCGSDGVSYANACLAECAGVFDYTPGECSNGVVDLTPISLEFDSPVEVPTTSLPLEITIRIDNIGTLDFSGTISTQFCLSDTPDPCGIEIGVQESSFVNIPAGGSQNVTYTTSAPYLLSGEYFWVATIDVFDDLPESNINNQISGPITIIGNCDCGDLAYNPVCGLDGMTYDNSCAALCAGVFDYTIGECSSCEDNCPDNVAPVCGSDGVTYENGCVAECNGIFDYTPGECPIGNDGVDLELDIIAPATFNIYNNVTFQYRVFNNGTVNAENVIVDVPLPEGFVHSSNSTSNGEFDLFREQWEAGTIKVGETVVLDLNLFALTNSAVTVYAQVASANPDDIDSTPGNGTCCTPNEDDEAAITIGQNLQDGNGTSALSAPNSHRDLDIKTIYPNIATDELTIFVQSKLPELHLRVYNLQGNEVMQQKYQNTEGFQRLPLDVSTLPTGTYLLRFDGTLGRQTQRFVKLKM